MTATKEQGKAWYYAYGGFHGEPDYCGPSKLARDEANARWGANYDISGPFETRKAANEHLDAWLASVED